MSDDAGLALSRLLFVSSLALLLMGWLGNWITAGGVGLLVIGAEHKLFLDGNRDRDYSPCAARAVRCIVTVMGGTT